VKRYDECYHDKEKKETFFQCFQESECIKWTDDRKRLKKQINRSRSISSSEPVKKKATAVKETKDEF
jgi:hypothetical protein